MAVNLLKYMFLGPPMLILCGYQIGTWRERRRVARLADKMIKDIDRTLGPRP